MNKDQELNAYIKKLDALIKQKRYFSENIGVPVLMLQKICDELLKPDPVIKGELDCFENDMTTPEPVNNNKGTLEYFEKVVFSTIRDIALKKTSKIVLFSELLVEMPKIGRKLLIDSLKEIEHKGFIKRTVKREIIILD